MATADLDSLLAAIADRYTLRRGAGRFSGPCPKCGGSSSSDKFVIKDDGGFKCYVCDFKGDIITWLRKIEGMTCPQAHEEAGQPCRSISCAVRGTCRQGDGSGVKVQAKSSRSLAAPQAPVAPVVPVVTPKAPLTVWQSWAESMVVRGEKGISDQPEALAWLALRGIAAAAVIRFRIGWLNHSHKIDRAAIGLPPKGDKTTLWVPDGLLIPTLSADGTIHRIRVRRPAESRAKFLPDLKYVWIEGSGNCPLVIHPHLHGRGVVIVEAELDAMACAAAHSQVLVIAIGTVSGGLTPQMRATIDQAPVILVALDADPAKEGKQGAGPKSIAAWLKAFRQARFWPVPSGKDPGDYATAGGNLRAWVESGLIPEVSGVPAMTSKLSLGVSLRGAGGEDIKTPAVKHYTATLTDGRAVNITDSRELWEELTAAGELVWTEQELCRFNAACATMTDRERSQAALLTCDLKEVFAGAYIAGGSTI